MKTNLSVIFIFCFAVVASVSAGTPPLWSASFNSTKSFVENKGQFASANPSFGGFNDKDKLNGSEILFSAEENGAKIYFSKNGFTYRFDKIVPKEASDESDKKAERSETEKTYAEREKEEHAVKTITDIVHMQWENANPDVEVIASDQSSDYYTYSMASGKFIAHAFKTITYRNLYPGIDVVFSFHPDQGIKYSLVVHPGADASLVKMKWNGSGKTFSDENGNTHIATLFGDIVDHAPLTFYQQAANLKGKSQNPKPESVIASRFATSNGTTSFDLENYDHSQTIVIDPWVVNPGFLNSNVGWEIEADSSGNAYIFGGGKPIQLKKYDSAGVLQWTYTTPWDTSSWIGTLKTDPAGNSYITCGSIAEIEKIDATGLRLWHANGGSLDEYWGLAFNSNCTQLIAGGTRLVGLMNISGDGKAYDIDMTNGSVNKSVSVAKIIPSFLFNDINEIRSICYSPNGNYYFHTLDTIGALDSSLNIKWRLLTSYRFAYISPHFGYTPQPQHIIRASANYIYTIDGANIYRRDLNTGAIINSDTIPGGGFAPGGTTPGISPYNNGIDLDSCGNVYVGSQTQILKFDSTLKLIASAPTPGAVYDLAVSNNGEVFACGNGFVTAINMSACRQVSNHYYNPANSQNRVKGTCFTDYNQNGIQDAAEPPFKNLMVVSTGTVNTFSSQTDTLGFYINYITDTGSVTTALTPPSYYTVSPTQHLSPFATFNNDDTVNFALVPIPGIQDLRITIIPLAKLKLGRDVVYRLNYSNVGTDTMSGVIKMQKDSRTLFKGSSVGFLSINGDSASWSYSNLLPNESGFIDVTLTVLQPPVVNVGDSLSFSGVIEPLATDNVPADNYSGLSTQPIVNSWDPNDKSMLGGETFTTDQLKNGEFFTYLIRFQNTGNDTAYKVVIHDTLDSKLDGSTFEMISASNNYNLIIKNRNIITWSFYNILLPDSNVNEPASHGYVCYRIKAKTTANGGDLINNTANIDFDYNMPVTTNTSQTTIVLTTNIASLLPASGFQLYPNPTNGEFTVYTSALRNIDAALIVYDFIGNKIYSTILNSNKKTINCKQWPSGIYFIRIEGTGNTGVVKMVKME